VRESARDMRLNWYRTVDSSRNSEYIQSRRYTCGYCGEPLASEVGYTAFDVNEDNKGIGVSLAKIYICHHCSSPTYFDRNGVQTPGTAFGRPVSNISKEEVKSLYDEACNCMKVSAYTAAVMCCRKLLMNVAVDQGADENKPFAYYVDYLAKQGYLPPDGKKWVGHIKDKGNEANHEIPVMRSVDAKELIEFTEMMLKFIYEYPARMEDRAHIVDSQGE
jgi:Domain of unknown function (DUF4145)